MLLEAQRRRKDHSWSKDAMWGIAYCLLSAMRKGDGVRTFEEDPELVLRGTSSL